MKELNPRLVIDQRDRIPDYMFEMSVEEFLNILGIELEYEYEDDVPPKSK